MQEKYVTFGHYYTDEAIIYATPACKIGVHEWRYVVYRNRRGSPPMTYHWRRIGNVLWQDQEQWPTYNHNDGMYAGCPKSCADIYRKYFDKINKAMGGDLFLPYNPKHDINPQQTDLFC